MEVLLLATSSITQRFHLNFSNFQGIPASILCRKVAGKLKRASAEETKALNYLYNVEV
jgi:hypothetical protein